MAIQKFISYFNPFVDFHAIEKFKKLNHKQQAWAIIAATAGAFASFFILFSGGIAAFRGVVNHYHPDELSEKISNAYANTVAQKASSKPSDVTQPSTHASSLSRKVKKEAFLEMLHPQQGAPLYWRERDSKNTTLWCVVR